MPGAVQASIGSMPAVGAKCPMGRGRTAMPGMVQASIVGATPAVGAKCPTGAREHGDPGAVRLRSSGRRPQSGRNVRWRRGRTAMPGAVRAAIVGSAPAVGAKCPMAARENGGAGRGPGFDRRVDARSRGDMPDGGEGERRCRARSELRSSGRRPQSGRNARWRRGRTAVPARWNFDRRGQTPVATGRAPFSGWLSRFSPLTGAWTVYA